MPSTRGASLRSNPVVTSKTYASLLPAIHLDPYTPYMLSRVPPITGKYVDVLQDNLAASVSTPLENHVSAIVGTAPGLAWERLTAADKTILIGAGTGIAVGNTRDDTDKMYRVDTGAKITRLGGVFTSSASSRDGLLFHTVSATNTLGLTMRGNLNALQFIQINGGSTTVLGSVTNALINSTGYTAHLAIEKPDPNGNVFNIYLNGVFQFTVTSSVNATERRVGVVLRAGDFRGLHGY